MFAIFETGGKQYRAEVGEVLDVEKLAAEAGEKVHFKQVYLVSGKETEVGMPYVEGAQVNATVVKHDKGNKVRVVKFQAKKRHSSEQGHRQLFTQIKIDEIVTGVTVKPPKKAAKKADEKVEEPVLEATEA